MRRATRLRRQSARALHVAMPSPHPAHAAKRLRKVLDRLAAKGTILRWSADIESRDTTQIVAVRTAAGPGMVDIIVPNELGKGDMKTLIAMKLKFAHV